jgi:F0F1-type ATP synthase assembly protein I
MAGKKSAGGWKALNLATNIGITMAASVLIGFYMGHCLDKWILHDPKVPGLTFIFSLFGIAAGFRGVFRLINQTLDDGGKE